jgi:hypothetical protein
MIRVVSRVEVWEGLSRGSILGFMSEVMLVWVRLWGVPVRLMTMGTMSIFVPCQCERRSFAMGVYFYMMRRWVSLKLMTVQHLVLLFEFYE